MKERHTQNPLRQGMRLKRLPDSNSLIIFGATGDLTKRKLVPALFSLFEQNLLPNDFNIVAFARRPKTTEQFRQEMQDGLKEYGDFSGTTKEKLEGFLSIIHYFQYDFSLPDAYPALAKYIQSLTVSDTGRVNLLYYLATPPSKYQTIIDHLGAAKMAQRETGWTRIIIEKPFGRDLESAKDLNRVVGAVFNEDQVYRIDHYLGKETVQNILVFRFANGIFEPLWNRRYVDHVQITVAESIGVGTRGRFFEETGILRDIAQNHMLQLLCLVGMEPPIAFEANAVRDEKVKVLNVAVFPKHRNMDRFVIRGQYTAGSLWGEKIAGYLEEEGVSPESTTETYVALKLYIDNWRWAGVPFYLRTGKRLPKRVTEIAIHFKDAPLQLFGPDAADEITSNTLALNIQPDEGISLRFDSKVPGPAGQIRPVTMDFRYGTSFGESAPDAYERLLLDAMIGDSTLFTRSDESEMAWKIMTPIQEHWQSSGQTSLPGYRVGTWGPKEADELLKRDFRQWRRL